jgi:hypothetical protein
LTIVAREVIRVAEVDFDAFGVKPQWLSCAEQTTGQEARL